MPLTFGQPWCLLLLGLIPLLAFIGRRSLAGLDPTRRRMALGLRSLGVLALVLALAEVQWRDDRDLLEVVFLLDRSRSIPTKLQDKSLEAVNAARKSMRSTDRDRARLMVFARDAIVEQAISPESEAVSQVTAVIGPDQTNLGKAIDSALNTFESGAKKRLVVFSDGNETSGDSRRMALMARDLGAVVDVVPLRYRLEKEVFVDKIVLPPEVKIGEPYQVRVVVRSLAKTAGTLELYEGNDLVESRRVELEPGIRVESFARLVKKSGLFNVRALFRTDAESDDSRYQNNQAFGFVFVRGESKVLYVHGQANGPTGPLVEALRLERITADVRAPAQVPRDANQLQIYDTVILDNVPKAELTIEQQRAIAGSVQRLGLGLVMIGGSDGFGAGGWSDEPVESTPIEQALPVRMEPKQKTVITNGALGIIMHSCEFDNGNEQGRQVTMKAIEALSAKDFVGVVYYENMTGGATWRFPIQPATDKPKLKGLIKGMEPGDMPDFDASMALMIPALVASPASTKHMIILSDGDPSAPRPGLLRTCRDNKITISTIAIQPHGGPRGTEVALMKRIANATGGKFYYLSDPRALPKIFIKETKRVARPLIRNIDFVPRIVADSPIIKGFKEFPALKGHVLADRKERATLVLDTPEKEAQPVLVHWRYGVGKSVAFLSDAGPTWSGDWLSWSGYTSFWGQLVRWAGKDVEDANYQVATRINGDRGKVVVDAIDEDGEFISGLSIEGTVTGPGGEIIPVSLESKGPGRYEGEFPVGDVGNYTVSLVGKSSKSNEQTALTTGLVFPYSDEYKTTQSADELLAELAKVTGGRVVDVDKASSPEAKFFDHDLRNQTSLVPQWERLLQLMIVLFVIDVFVRRVMLDYAKIWASIRGRLRGLPPPEESTTSTLARLKERKAAMRGAELGKFDADERFAEQGAVAGSKFGGPVDEANSGGRPSGPSRPPPPSDEPDAMSRLLRAKRRAHDKGDEG